MQSNSSFKTRSSACITAITKRWISDARNILCLKGISYREGHYRTKKETFLLLINQLTTPTKCVPWKVPASEHINKNNVGGQLGYRLFSIIYHEKINGNNRFLISPESNTFLVLFSYFISFSFSFSGSLNTKKLLQIHHTFAMLIFIQLLFISLVFI